MKQRRVSANISYVNIRMSLCPYVYSGPSLYIFAVQSNLNSSNTDRSFTIANSNSFLSPYVILPITQENKYLRIFFLISNENVCCVYSLESPHRGDSNEYTQHNIIV